MNDKIKTQIIGACRQQGCNDADAEHIAVSVLNTLQPVLADAARFRMVQYISTNPGSPEHKLFDEIMDDIETQTELTAKQHGEAGCQAVDAVREKFGDRP